MVAGQAVGQMAVVASQGWEIQVAQPLQQAAIQMVVGAAQMEVASQMLEQAQPKVAEPVLTESQGSEAAPL